MDYGYEMPMAEKNILNTILETKHNEVEYLLSKRSLSDWRQLAEAGPVCRDFHEALAKQPQCALNLIAEVKRASPSAGIIREDFDPPAIARQYEAGGASAISVLTDSEYFSGSLEYLKSVREAVTLPVLRKDFIIDPCQVYESRSVGADAILLIAAGLEPVKLLELLQLANGLGMTCLLEVHNAEELRSVIRAVGDDLSGGGDDTSQNLLGINNRDLTTFKVDIQTTINLAAMAGSDVAIISESGIKTREDVELLRAGGAVGMLVGQTLMESDDIPAAIEKLIGKIGAGR